MRKEKFEHKKATFEFTTSNEPGRYNMWNDNWTHHNIATALPEDVAKEFAKILESTLNSMDFNKATKITMTCKWK